MAKSQIANPKSKIENYLTCIMCPIGCEMDVERRGDEVEVTGNRCEKGPDFAREEIIDPKRNLATSLPIRGKYFRTLSVRLSDRVSRHLVRNIVKEIAQVRVAPPVKRGQVLLANIMNTGVDVIATRTVE